LPHTGPGRVLALACALMAIACSNETAARPDSHSATYRAAFDSASDRLLAGLRADSPDSVLFLMTDDVVLMPPNEPVLTGNAAVRAWYDQLLTQFRTTSLSVKDREVWLEGEWATEVAAFEWTLTPTAGGAQVVDRGHYQQLWRREPDGRYMLFRELWNSAP
jgi:ketosteroid isomerase-like protein